MQQLKVELTIPIPSDSVIITKVQLEKFKKELNSMFGGFVYYRQNRGQPWSFQASRMAEFLDKKFHRIFV